MTAIPRLEEILAEQRAKSAARLDPAVRATYAALGLSLDHADWELPMPATYVIDPGGVIRFAHVDPDYAYRAEPAAVLAALEGLA